VGIGMGGNGAGFIGEKARRGMEISITMVVLITINRHQLSSRIRRVHKHAMVFPYCRKTQKQAHGTLA